MACDYKTIMCGLWTKHVKCVSWDAKIKYSLDKIWDWCFCVALGMHLGSCYLHLDCQPQFCIQ